MALMHDTEIGEQSDEYELRMRIVELLEARAFTARTEARHLGPLRNFGMSREAATWECAANLVRKIVI